MIGDEFTDPRLKAPLRHLAELEAEAEQDAAQAQFYIRTLSSSSLRAVSSARISCALADLHALLGTNPRHIESGLGETRVEPLRPGPASSPMRAGLQKQRRRLVPESLAW